MRARTPTPIWPGLGESLKSEDEIWVVAVGGGSPVELNISWTRSKLKMLLQPVPGHCWGSLLRFCSVPQNEELSAYSSPPEPVAGFGDFFAMRRKGEPAKRMESGG